ncbi:hypothetical protein PHLGIDRAFT_235500 [Phlebiopsis gigantea 11061_1 CR5-6]|uniref:Uncharacterized protein n=1 Tax=Phlebiopsis gigantea (strain 11061_1 CR5-6) TaxID=745531 RepID=A0A0C3S5G6_PHLG1|nr:hypothetical protein PHLGIDRAFT_235500 [Phlebiopsis gigantea 11061_1 CR5-6]
MSCIRPAAHRPHTHPTRNIHIFLSAHYPHSPMTRAARSRSTPPVCSAPLRCARTRSRWPAEPRTTLALRTRRRTRARARSTLARPSTGPPRQPPSLARRPPPSPRLRECQDSRVRRPPAGGRSSM